MTDATPFPPPPRQTANPSPVRALNSVRRTCSLDVAWPKGAEGHRLVHGRVRDYLTGADGAGQVLAEATMEAGLEQDRTIFAISANPAPARLHELVGTQAGNHLRVLVRDIMPDLIEQASPLYLALDDISGTSLVSAWTWSNWSPDWMARLREMMPTEDIDRMLESRTNVCWGLKEGNSGLRGGLGSHITEAADAGELRNPEDPEGWHLFPEIAGPSFRRARRIDVTRDGDMLHVSASFQDSAPSPEGPRKAVHEYELRLVADAETLVILAIEPIPHILPFPECPGAVANAQRMVGTRISDIRDSVLAMLRKTEGCTHLNDALRALADVPKLAQHLRRD